jgi:hypothetical protein
MVNSIPFRGEKMKLKVILFILSYCLGPLVYSGERLSQSNKIIFGTKSSKLSGNKTITYDVTFEKERALTGQLFLLTAAGISTGQRQREMPLQVKLFSLNAEENHFPCLKHLREKLSQPQLQLKNS